MFLDGIVFAFEQEEDGGLDASSGYFGGISRSVCELARRARDRDWFDDDILYAHQRVDDDA